MIVESFSEEIILKNKLLLLFVQTYQKRKEVPFMDMARDNDWEGEESPYMELSVTMTKKGSYVSNELLPENNSSTFIHKSKWLFSATSILCR